MCYKKSSRIFQEDNMTLHSEIFEQPERLTSLLDHQKQTVLTIAKAIQSRDVQYAFLAARGTSDNAGRYANYLWGAHNGIPLALATPSLFTYYQMPPRLNTALFFFSSRRRHTRFSRDWSSDVCSSD